MNAHAAQTFTEHTALWLSENVGRFHKLEDSSDPSALEEAYIALTTEAFDNAQYPPAKDLGKLRGEGIEVEGGMATGQTSAEPLCER